MKKLMVILITGLLYMSCTDSMEVSGDADRNNTEDVSVRLVITIPASTTYARTRGHLRRPIMSLKSVRFKC